MGSCFHRCTPVSKSVSSYPQTFPTLDKAFDLLLFHYENTPIQIHRKFHFQKLKKLQTKNSDIFNTFAQNIDCGYALEQPRRGGSYEYPQSMFWAKIRKIMYTPVNPSFTIKSGVKRGPKYIGMFSWCKERPMRTLSIRRIHSVR